MTFRLKETNRLLASRDMIRKGNAKTVSKFKINVLDLTAGKVQNITVQKRHT